MKNTFYYILKNCVENERKKVLIIYDDTTSLFIQGIYKAAEELGKEIEIVKVENSGRHGVEPGRDVSDRMVKSDVVMALTKYSLAHTSARKQLSQIGIPFLSMPDYNLDMLSNPAHYVEYKAIYSVVNKYSDILSKGKTIRVVTEKGTDITMDISDRQGNSCPGIVNEEFLLGSPPDIEANIAPIEDNTNGTIVVDGSITDYRIGLLKNPIMLDVKNGKIVNIQADDFVLKMIISDIFKEVNSENAYYVGEFGIGFNDMAQICGNMLIDEGAKGCIHFGMGSNWTIGGSNIVSFHLDFVVKEATVWVDDELIIDKGVVIYE